MEISLLHKAISEVMDPLNACESTCFEVPERREREKDSFAEILSNCGLD